MNDPTAVSVAPWSFEIAPLDCSHLRSHLRCARTLTRHKLDCDLSGGTFCIRAKVRAGLPARMTQVPAHDTNTCTGFGAGS